MPDRPKAITLDAILNLSEDEIRARFAAGIYCTDGERWLPAKGAMVSDAWKSLGAILKLKEDRQLPGHFLHRDSSHGYTTDPGLAMRPDAGEAPPQDFQARVTLDSHHREAIRQREDLERVAREDHKRLSARAKSYVIRAARCGIDPMPTLAAVERVLAKAEADLEQIAA